MQKTALICIAKNEDRYIAEWIKYHIALGFDKVFVYQNNWRCTDHEALSIQNVKWIEWDGEKRQMHAYNNFINKHINDFDWAAFFDCDEFLVIKQYSFESLLKRANDFYGIGINWKYFGNNGIVIDDGSKGVLNRFIKCASLCNMHIKTMLHLTKCKHNHIHPIFYGDPHHTSISKRNSNSKNIIASDFKTFINGPFNIGYNDNNIFLAHFFCKTYNEFINIKYERGRADTGTKCSLEDFDHCNLNEVEDTYLRDFFDKNCI